jgi:UDP-glucose 4-epimerase
LCDEWYSVVVFDNFSLDLHQNIDVRVAEVIKGDVLNTNDLKKALNKGIDIIFHCATSI